MLEVNHLTGFGAGGGIPVSVTFIAKTADTVDRTTYTFAAHSLGTPADTRRIYVGVAAASTSATISTVSVAGVSATQHVLLDVGSAEIGIWSALVPTGSTGDIVVTMSAGAVRCVINVWAVEHAAAAPYDTGSSSAHPQSDTINVQAGGAVLGVAFDTGTGSYSWTGITEDADGQHETQTFSSAHSEFASAASGLTVTATGPNGSANIMALVSIEPQ